MSLEKKIEKKVCDYAKKNGFLALKINVVGERGWPDRLFIDPDGWCVWIEFKAPGKKPDPIQQHRMEDLMNRGIPVFVIDNEEIGLAVIKELVAARVPKESDEALTIAGECGIILGPGTRED